MFPNKYRSDNTGGQILFRVLFVLLAIGLLIAIA